MNVYINTLSICVKKKKKIEMICFKKNCEIKYISLKETCNTILYYRLCLCNKSQ